MIGGRGGASVMSGTHGREYELEVAVNAVFEELRRKHPKRRLTLSVNPELKYYCREGYFAVTFNDVNTAFKLLENAVAENDEAVFGLVTYSGKVMLTVTCNDGNITLPEGVISEAGILMTVIPVRYVVPGRVRVPFGFRGRTRVNARTGFRRFRGI